LKLKADEVVAKDRTSHATIYDTEALSLKFRAE
jgi:hypothetical protein